MSALLRFDAVDLIRGGRLLFERLSFALEAGDALHLTGPNGSGKSSLIRLAAGLLRPSAGRVESGPIALADDHCALDRELPLAEALGFWARLSGGHHRLPVAIESLGLAHLAVIPVRMLSMGQLNRAGLARMFLSGAPLWLLDEPLNGLDRDGVARLDLLIDAHRRSGGAVLAASHGPLGGTWAGLELGR